MTPPGIFVPFGMTIGKSATDDMGRTAPPGRDVPVGRLFSAPYAERVAQRPPEREERNNRMNLQHPFGDSVIGVIFNTVSIWDDCILESENHMIRLNSRTHRDGLLDSDGERMHWFSRSDTRRHWRFYVF